MNLELSLKKLLASLYSFVIKVQFCHWNVTGANFVQYHKFFDDLYNEVVPTIDRTAEHLRALDIYAPGSLARFVELSEINDQVNVPRASAMFEEILHDNQKIIDLLEQVQAMSTDHGGIQNFVQERLEQHTKWAWMLRSIGRRDRD